MAEYGGEVPGCKSTRIRLLNFQGKSEAAIAIVGGAALLLLAQSRPVDPQAMPPGPAALAMESSGLAVPFHFEKNLGQTSASVRYLSRGPGYILFLTPTGAVIKLAQASPAARGSPIGNRINRSRVTAFHRDAPAPLAVPALRSQAVRISFDGAKPDPEIQGLDPMAGSVNYFLGNDPTKWRTSIPTYARVKYREVWPGVDVVYYGGGGALEYDLIVAPRANPGAIRLGVEGAGVELQRNGDVALKTAIGDLKLCRLRLYQYDRSGARRAVAGKFALLPNHGAAKTIAVQVAGYDRSRALTIDPQIVYATYLGGSGGTSQAAAAVGDEATAVALDPLNGVYLTGFAFSTDFPTTIGGADPGASSDTPVAFVAKLNLTMSGAASLVYSTYLGGSGNPNSKGLDGDQANGIAVDDLGDAFVAGFTFSTDFPVVAGAFQSSDPTKPCVAQNSCTDAAFVAELDSDGSRLVYSTYLGGANNTEAERIALVPGCSACNAYVAGFTDSSNFPTVNGIQTALHGPNGAAFAAVLNSGGSALTYSTFLGGSGDSGGGGDGAMGIAADPSGNAYVTGFTSSSNFPTTIGAFQGMNRAFGVGEENCFVTKLNPAASGSASMVYSTYLGGSGAAANPGDFCYDVAADSSGDAFVTGLATSSNFPVTANAYQGTNRAAARGGMNAFATKVSPGGSSLLYSTMLGGSGGPLGIFGEEGSDIALDRAGDIYLTGTAASTDFPTSAGACQTVNRSTTKSFNAFVTELNPDASPASAQLVFSSYFGGSLSDGGNGITVDNSGKIYVSGYATSPDLPTTLGAAFQTAKKASGKQQANAFLAEIDPTMQCARLELTPQSISFPPRGVGAPPVTKTFSIENAGRGVLQGQVGTLSSPFIVTAAVGDFTVNPGQSVTVRVEFAPTLPAVSQQMLQVSSNDPYHQLTPIVVTGTGQAGVLLVASSLKFGMVRLNRHKTASLLVKNVGIGTLDGVVATGGTQPPFSVLSGGGPFTLKAGKKAAIVIEFSPTTIGRSASTLIVAPSNSSQSPTLVSLVGTGK